MINAVKIASSAQFVNLIPFHPIITDAAMPHTWFEGLDGNWCSSIPHSRPHLPKVPSTQLLLKLEGGSLNLPLIPETTKREKESRI
jgi:hypothetical protein